MKKITGKQHRKQEIDKLLKKKKRTLFEAAKLVSLIESAVTPTCWDMEKFKRNRNENCI